MTTWEIDGAAALATCAPASSAAYARVVEVRPAGVHDELLDDPVVAELARELAARAADGRDDGSALDSSLQARLDRVVGGDLTAVGQMLWIADTGARVRTALDAIFEPSAWETPRRFPVKDVGSFIDDLVQTVTAVDLTDGPGADAARRLAEAMRGEPLALDAALVDDVRRELTPAQAVAVVLGVVRDSRVFAPA